MKRNLAGRPLNPIGLGCMGLTHGYGVPPEPEAGAKVLLRALELGYDHLDTANIYGAGRNETLIGDTAGESSSSPARPVSCSMVPSAGRIATRIPSPSRLMPVFSD